MYKGKYEQRPTPAAPAAAKIPTPEPQTAPSEAPAVRPAPQRRPAPKRKRRKRTTKGTYIFYGVYAAIILVFFIVLGIAMGALKNWLIDFQAALPEDASQKVFSALFTNPDWGEIYALANPNDSNADNQAAYAAYMEDQVGDKKLAYIETAADPSGNNKYIVYYIQDEGNGTAIGTFTITADSKDAKVPDWKLGTVEIFFSRNLSFDIITLPGHTVTVNGETLTENNIISTVSTKAEEYLPDGFHGYQLLTYQVTGLMATPEVVVTDAAGQTVEMVFDEAKCTYTQTMPEAATISDDEYNVVLSATKAYSEFMIAGSYGFTKYFDTNSEIYKAITGGMIIRQKYSSYKFLDETISDYYQYGDNLFSARINLVTEVTRKDGTVKEFEVDSTFIFDKSSGKWIVHDMVNLDIQEQITHVRLTYKDADGNVLSSELVASNTISLTAPAITAPEGQVFTGWYKETVSESGDTTLSFMFKPDANGNVSVAGQELEAMTLVPRFENVKEEG